MTLPVVVDVAIGLLFIYLLYSLLVTIIQEMLSSSMAFRAKYLEEAIYRMLEDKDYYKGNFWQVIQLFRKSKEGKVRKKWKKGLVSTPRTAGALFYAHPLVRFLSQGNVSQNVSYLSRETFSKVLIDLLRGDKMDLSAKADDLITEALKDEKFKRGKDVSIPTETLSFLRSLWTDCQGDVDAFKRSLETWFDDTMFQLTGWYKRSTRLIVFMVGLIIAVVFNVDTIYIVNKLEQNDDVRNQMTQMSGSFMQAYPDLYHAFQMNLTADRNKNERMYSDSIRKLKWQIQQKDTVRSDSLDSFVVMSLKAKLEKVLNDSIQNLAKLDSTSKNVNDSLASILKEYAIMSKSLIQGELATVDNIMGTGIGSLKWSGLGGLLKSIAGWLITALAISLGAPFWFDLLGKMMSIRSAMAVPAGKKK
jgi:hypothetical protein